MAATKKLQMVFALEDGKKLTYSLSEPKDGITKAEVEAAMNSMITSNIVSKNGVAASTIAEAYVRTTENVELA